LFQGFTADRSEASMDACRSRSALRCSLRYAPVARSPCSCRSRPAGTRCALRQLVHSGSRAASLSLAALAHPLHGLLPGCDASARCASGGPKSPARGFGVLPPALPVVAPSARALRSLVIAAEKPKPGNQMASLPRGPNAAYPRDRRCCDRADGPRHSSMKGLTRRADTSGVSSGRRPSGKPTR